MKEYLLLFRSIPTGNPTMSNDDNMAGSMEKWKNWMGSIAAAGKLNGGQPLTQDGKFMSGKNKITDIPMAEGKEVVNGYLLIKANDYNDAVEISKGCPIFEDNGGSVEVREIMLMQM